MPPASLSRRNPVVAEKHGRYTYVVGVGTDGKVLCYRRPTRAPANDQSLQEAVLFDQLPSQELKEVYRSAELNGQFIDA